MARRRREHVVGMPRAVETAAPLVPPAASLAELRAAAAECKACPLWKTGTQTVFGEGDEDARVLFVGEQPGDQEDLEGRPFVGPAGRLLDKALADAGIERRLAYVTNAVKHFKWVARGKRGSTRSRARSRSAACRPWLEAELAVVAARRARLPGRDRRAGAARPHVQGHPAAGPPARDASRAGRRGHGAPVLDPARRPGGPRGGLRALVEDLKVVADLLEHGVRADGDSHDRLF